MAAARTGASLQPGTAPRPFDPKVVFGVLLFGAIAFVAALYFIGTGQTNSGTNDGAAHGAGKGLNGYAAIARLLEEDGHSVTLSRSQAKLKDTGLLILTPPAFADAQDITSTLNGRRYTGPTLVILPKWFASQTRPSLTGAAQDGWVALAGVSTPGWIAELERPFAMSAVISDMSREQIQWAGLGKTGRLPVPDKTMSLRGGDVRPLVTNPNGDALAGYVQDGARPAAAEPEFDDDGYRIDRDDNAGYDDAAFGGQYHGGKWPVIFVAEPDLFNNYGFADLARADLAHQIIHLAMGEEDLPIIFDLTLNGLGTSENLLTLAFTPPFLAATLCLALAMMIIAWRAFRRFGPPVAEGRAIALGKARLVHNSAGLIQRSQRLHLLKGPYASMIRERIVVALALRAPDDAAIDRALAKRMPEARSFSQCSADLRSARNPQELLRAAAALKSLEKRLTEG
ncbi:DUF4350 domain-containing protein [Pontixanthobacter sp.]|uniref:DUF4350 domain-containing protein n=1 Tax=Pontixanthobacter sp. TaxID=2792078 RepID=UPI003C799CA8